MKQRFLAFLAVIAAAFALGGGSAFAGDSTAVAVNTKDGSSIVKIVFDIEQLFNGKPVDSGNAAVAVSSCNSCQTVAVAIQIVLASGSPSVVVPENVAIAMNVDCNLCQTLADAYQYVYVTSQPMTFTKAGKERIKEIQRQLHDLEKSGLPIEQIQSRVVELTGQIQDVLQTELIPLDNGHVAGGDGGASQDATGTDTTPADTGTSTTPTDTGTQTTPTDTGTGTGTSTTPSDTGTSTTPTDTGTGTSTTPSDTGTSTTPTDTGTGTSTTPSSP
jgi:putative peptide zinc metalloprotease protein